MHGAPYASAQFAFEAFPAGQDRHSDAPLDASTPPFIAPFPASLHNRHSDSSSDALMAEYLPLEHSEQNDLPGPSWYLPRGQSSHAVKLDEFVAELENLPRCVTRTVRYMDASTYTWGRERRGW